MFKINIKTKKVYYELLDNDSNLHGLKTVFCKKDVKSNYNDKIAAYAGKEYIVTARSHGGWGMSKSIDIKAEPDSMGPYYWLGHTVDLSKNDAFYKRRFRKKNTKKEEDDKSESNSE